MGLLSKVNQELARYKNSHHGEMPLYILVSADELHMVIDELKAEAGYTTDVAITTYQGSKIAQHDVLKKGEILLTNELPETSS